MISENVLRLYIVAQRGPLYPPVPSVLLRRAVKKEGLVD